MQGITLFADNDFTRSPAAASHFFRRLTPPLVAVWGLVLTPLNFPLGLLLSSGALLLERRNLRRRWSQAVSIAGMALGSFIALVWAAVHLWAMTL